MSGLCRSLTSCLMTRAYAGTMTMTWEVEAAEAGTRVDIRADNVPSDISAEAHPAGLASSLANLAAHLEG